MRGGGGEGPTAAAVLPRLERYLSGLAGGLSAYPACLAKGALVRNLFHLHPATDVADRLPEPLRTLALEPPMGSEWIPEVHFAALLLAVADLRGLDEPALRAWTRDRNRLLFASPAYRILMAVASPAQLLRFAGARWCNWHRGSSLEIDGIGDDGVRVSLHFPAALIDGSMAVVYGEAFTAALEVARARLPRVDVVELTAARARFLATWS